MVILYNHFKLRFSISYIFLNYNNIFSESIRSTLILVVISILNLLINKLNIFIYLRL